MAEFNWVKGRLDCSINAAFKKLRAGVESDVTRINEAAQARSKQDQFEVSSFADRSVVMRKKFDGVASVEFSITGYEIVAATGDEGKTVIAKAAPTLNQEGNCLLVVDGRDMDLWQF